MEFWLSGFSSKSCAASSFGLYQSLFPNFLRVPTARRRLFSIFLRGPTTRRRHTPETRLEAQVVHPEATHAVPAEPPGAAEDTAKNSIKPKLHR